MHGIDELRSFNYFNDTVIPCYGNKNTISAIRTNFDYIFNATTQVGGGLPKLTLNTLHDESFSLGGVAVTPLNILHGGLNILGYRKRSSQCPSMNTRLEEARVDIVQCCHA